MVTAGETIIAGKVPGERIGTTVETSDSSAIGTTETAVISVTAATVTGRVYQVTLMLHLSASVASDDCQINIREDNASGTILTATVIDAPIVNRIPPVVMVCQYTADATENKVIVATIDRVAGSGNFTMLGSATRPSLLFVDYVSG